LRSHLVQAPVLRFYERARSRPIVARKNAAIVLAEQRQLRVQIAAVEHGAVELFLDWCMATGASPSAVSCEILAAFFADAPAARSVLRRRAKALAAAGLINEAVLSAFFAREQPTPNGAKAALNSVAIGGWPEGFVGRRDAAIVALARIGGFTKSEIAACRLGDVPDIARRLDASEPPGSCARCAVARWIWAWQVVAAGGRHTAMAMVEDIGARVAGDAMEHECLTPMYPMSSYETSMIFNPIDRNGAMELGRPLSRRSISKIVSSRLSATVEVPARAVGTVWRVVLPTQSAAMRRRLDSLCDELDTVADGVERLLSSIHLPPARPADRPLLSTAIVSSMSALNQPRRPAGTPAGGQFAPKEHLEPDVALLPVEDLQPGMLVDLAGDPYADPDGNDSALQYEFATVDDDGAKQETPDCTAVSFDHDVVGFPHGHKVKVVGTLD